MKKKKPKKRLTTFELDIDNLVIKRLRRGVVYYIQSSSLTKRGLQIRLSLNDPKFEHKYSFQRTADKADK